MHNQANRRAGLVRQLVGIVLSLSICVVILACLGCGSEVRQDDVLLSPSTVARMIIDGIPPGFKVEAKNDIDTKVVDVSTDDRSIFYRIRWSDVIGSVSINVVYKTETKLVWSMHPETGSRVFSGNGTNSDVMVDFQFHKDIPTSASLSTTSEDVVLWNVKGRKP